ncbi:MAG: LCP family protein [Clostridia bacterium]|nr:LCP family protein [Clostridia bacterium]
MSRSKNKPNKYDSDIEYTVDKTKVKAYSRDDAFKDYVPMTYVSNSGQKPKKKSKAGKVILIILLVLLLFIALLAGAFLFLQHQGKKELVSYEDATIESIDDALSEDDGKTVFYNGKTYRLNENITSIACLGVDKKTLGTYGNKVGTGGQADTNMVLAIDTATGEITVIAIPRDIMVDIDLYSVSGEYLGNSREQLCLAYAYGDGKHASCKNSVASIQRVLFGMPVNSYISLDLAGIGPLNDAVGGVTVTSPETIAGFTAGQSVTLHGRDAVTFVQERGDDINASTRRMQRQMTYIRAFGNKAISAAIRDFGTVTRLYNAAQKYCCTNVGIDNVTYLATTLLSKGISDFRTVSVPGEMKMGEKYAEFYMDTTAAYEMILDVFYNEVV